MNIDDLFLCPICRNIPDYERRNFLDGLDFKTKSFKKGAWIAQQGDDIRALYLLMKGSVKTESIAESGTILNIETIHAPNPLASAFLFAEKNQFPVDVIALEDCEIITVYKESIIKQLACNKTFLIEFMAFNANRTQFLSERIKFLSIKTIKGKLAQYILENSKNNEFIMQYNQTKLSEYFGVTRPSLSRTLSEMVDDGIISLNGKQGKIKDKEKLKIALVKNL